MTNPRHFTPVVMLVAAGLFAAASVPATQYDSWRVSGSHGFGSPAAPVPAAKHAPQSAVIPPPLATVQQLAPADSGVPQGTSVLRYDTLKEVAHTLGVQAGVRHRYEAINAWLHTNRRSLDRLFDFRPLLLHDGRVAPPVINRADGAYRVASDTEAHQTQATYKIERDARLITRAPDWRDYLLHSYPMFEQPDDAVLPKNDAERQVWATAAEAGFSAGIAQADRLFDLHLARLRRDYLGMAQFALLALQGIVEVPMLAESRLGVVANGRMLSVGERLFRITASAGFRPVRRWQPVIQYVPATAVQVAPPQERAP